MNGALASYPLDSSFISNFWPSFNTFPPTMTVDDFLLTKDLIISLYHPVIYLALPQIFSECIFVGCTSVSLKRVRNGFLLQVHFLWVPWI